MAEFTSYPAGTPSWIDYASADLEATKAFYSGLFGWGFDDMGEEAGHYNIATLRGKQVAGVGPAMMEGQPPSWTTYIAVDDADAVVAKVNSEGGTVFAGPMDVMDAGRMAILADPTGAAFGIWQAGRNTGAQLANEPGTFTWNELDSRDEKAAEGFYTAVFDWTALTEDMGGMAYTQFQRADGWSVAGMTAMNPMVPAEVPSFWLTYFSVADTDETVATASGLGASVTVAPVDLPVGRFAVLADPAGAVFGVIKNS